MKKVKFNAWLPKIGIMLNDVDVYSSNLIGVSERYILSLLPSNMCIDYDLECVIEGEANPVMGVLPGCDYIFIDENEYTLLMSTQKHTLKGREVFEGDILFQEIEEEDGDTRIYLVVVWLEEQSSFAIMNTIEYDIHINEGFDDDEVKEFISTGKYISKLHYAGNVFLNKDKLDE